MGACCSSCSASSEPMTVRYRRILVVVVALNGIMFLVESIWSLVVGSSALQADALVFLADTLTYGLTLSVLDRSPTTRAKAALVKGGNLGGMAAHSGRGWNVWSFS
ncbi:hypothetical protein CCP1ISM_880003 [Azospirillaceae bacterium]